MSILNNYTVNNTIIPFCIDLDDQTEEENGVWSTEVIIGVTVAIVVSLTLCIIACLVICTCINRHNINKDQHRDETRQTSRVQKFTEAQKTIRYLTVLLLLANEEQTAYIKAELNSMQEHAGRLVDDGATGGAVADDGEEGTLSPTFTAHLSYAKIFARPYINRSIFYCTVELIPYIYIYEELSIASFHTETEIDSQKALTECLEELKGLAISEQFTRRLEEMCSKVSNPNHTTTTTGAAGELCKV